MSNAGLQKCAKLFSLMQETRIELMRDLDKQDLLLASMLYDGNEAMKEKFSKITLMKEEKK